METLITEIKTILNDVLPENTFIEVWGGKLLGSEYIGIAFACSKTEINRVRDQNPQRVSLMLQVKKMELNIQIFGGNGGGSVWLTPDLGSFNAMKRVKVPFKQPKKEKKFVMSAIERFAANWLKILKENKDRLMYKEYINYDEFLG